MAGIEDQNAKRKDRNQRRHRGQAIPQERSDEDSALPRCCSGYAEAALPMPDRRFNPQKQEFCPRLGAGGREGALKGRARKRQCDARRPSVGPQHL